MLLSPLLAAFVLLIAYRVLCRYWRDLVAGPEILGAPLAAAMLFLLAPLPPSTEAALRFHERFLAAVRADPYLLLDASDYQAHTGAWTREVAGRTVPFPAPSAFHFLAWPAAALLDDDAGLKTAAAVALGASLLLVPVLARAIGLPAPAGVIGQGLFALMPSTIALVLGFSPSLLGRAMELLLLVHLIRRFAHLQGARDAAAVCLFLVLAMAAAPGSVLEVGLLVVVLACGELAAGDPRRAFRLLGSFGLAAALVLAVQASRFFFVLWREVLSGPAGVGAIFVPGHAASAAEGLARSYHLIYPLLLVPGLIALRVARPHARRLLLAALLSGLAAGALRSMLSALLGDAQDIALLAAPIAVLSSAGLVWLWGRGPGGRFLALAGATGAVAWSLARAAALYSSPAVP